MVGRLFRLVGTAFATGIALVAPVVATTTATPASADTVVDGCTMVSNPTSTNFTNCPGVDFAGADLLGTDLSFANLAGSNLSGALLAQCAMEFQTCATGTNLTDANLRQANLTHITAADVTILTVTGGGGTVGTGGTPVPTGSAAIFSGANLSGANMSNSVYGAVDFSNANLTDADLTGSNLDEVSSPTLGGTFSIGANLNHANLTGTIAVPSNQSLSATSQAGAVATWSAPSSIPGATPGSCTPASGSNFPLLANTTVTCQVIDALGDVAAGTFQVNVTPTTQNFTRMLIPSGSVTLAGSQILDAAAADAPGVIKVQYELTGGTLNQAVIVTGALTLFGWLASLDTTTVPNGSYTLQSVATDAANDVSTSAPVTINVNNPPPIALIGVPGNGAIVKGGQWLDAGASPGVTQVTYELTGASMTNAVIATGVPTYVGWLAGFNSTTVPNGAYTLTAVASYAGGVSGTSPGVSITVSN